MEALNISWSQIADIGFLLVVTGISLRSLLVDRDALQKQRALWKKELVDLEGSLRELIGEATEASNVFDNKIQRRQRDLEALLNSIEAKVAHVANTSSHFKVVPAEDERFDPPWAKAMEDEMPAHLRGRLEDTRDKVGARGSVRARPSTQQNSAKSERSLREAIEIQAIEKDNYLFQQTNIVDPVSFKIAKRLLLEGKEIHVISRKLDIPASEIRHLESLLRINDSSSVEGSQLKQKEVADVKKVIRDPASRASKDMSREAQIRESLGLGSYIDELDRETRI